MLKKISAFLILLPLAACAPSQVPAPVSTVDEIKSKKFLSIAPEQPEPQVNRPDFHKISSGETLQEIAFNYGLDYRELAVWNGLSDPNKIYAGNLLRLSPTNNTPVTDVVTSQKSAGIVATPELVPSSPTPTAEPKPTRLTVGTTTPSSSPDGTNAPVKTSPLASKYPYDKNTLNKLRTAWQNKHATPTKTKLSEAATAPTPQPTTDGAPQTVRRRFDVDWSWPSSGGISQKFSNSSKGININGNKGDAVYASADGQVVYVGTGVKSYGRLVILKHKNDYLSAYAHNDEVFVKESQSVKRGQKIAMFGDSGTDRVMLHLEIRKAGKPFDPLQVLPAKP